MDLKKKHTVWMMDIYIYIFSDDRKQKYVLYFQKKHTCLLSSKNTCNFIIIIVFSPTYLFIYQQQNLYKPNTLPNEQTDNTMNKDNDEIVDQQQEQQVENDEMETQGNVGKCFDTLVLAGGGIYGMAHLGVALYLENTLQLGNIRRFIGTSIGALVACLLAFHFPVRAIEEFIAGRDMYDMVFGIPHSATMNHLDDFSAALLLFIKTQLQLPKELVDMNFETLETHFGTELQVTAFNLEKGCVEMFGPRTTPHTSIVKAVSASLCHPKLFSPTCVHSSYYIDGGIMYNFPIAEAPGPTTLGITFENVRVFSEKQTIHDNDDDDENSAITTTSTNNNRVMMSMEEKARLFDKIQSSHYQIYLLSSLLNDYYLRHRLVISQTNFAAHILTIQRHPHFTVEVNLSLC
jgi:predicted acylesterase/phospholipase RssA